jgi:hypothetical protein
MTERRATTTRKTTRPRVYISGPITKGDRNWNVYQAFAAMKDLMQAGFAPFNPMASCCYPFAWEPGFPADAWMELDLPFVAACDCLLRLPGESAGGDEEVAYAELIGVPVFHDLSHLIANRDAIVFRRRPNESIEWLSALCGEWSDATFGADRTGLPALHHLREEVGEVIDHPDDLLEWADCLMLLLDAARRRGIPIADLMSAAVVKLDICKRRQWGEPDENGVVHHVEA